ncbi:RagB/SusD family nutrient uptake outer membrane protein [Pedobacter sp. L105]|uniref:RagB/SusD family nutrient uptake outer membrane protein n=1 Tax=Pedobacter sp. L105 TaxID=1641871 RepID=UPI00131D6242|nr:RagB/SusD family nutrient uptake outer membrane protein [Pedobacter sp. L105]
MKKFIYIIALLTVFTSCKKFLDVKPESQIDKDQLFSTEEGFKEALNGVYTFCASQNLYGGNLTFSTLDIMAQNYDFSTNAILQKVASFDYTDPGTIAKKDTVWANAYRGIANCNNILGTIDSKKALFTANNYQIIKAEALTIRAYLHFDILRMFAPSYKSNPSAKAIPYVTTVINKTIPFSTVTQTLDLIIADLNNAKILLKETDPIVSSSYIVGYPDDPLNTEVTNPDLFLQNRRHRMNYYSVCGELARVYLYKNDLTNSLSNAQEVINSTKFPWTAEADFFQKDNTKIDRICYKELISAWYIPQSKIELEGLFTNANPDYSATTSQIEDIYEKAQSGADDWRFKQWFLKTTSITGGPERSMLQKYVNNTTPVVNLYPLVAPAIRLTEMYYIAAEASFESNPEMAMNYYNTVRLHRGIGATVTGLTDKQQLIELLLIEARKEFYGESQILFMYKRLNHAVKVSSTQVIPASDNIFVFPLPIDEQAYRNN